MLGNKRYKQRRGGYIALMSAIVMALVLTGLAGAVSAGGYHARSDALNSELKRVSLGLAESCVNTALLRIATNYNYTPAVSGDVVTVGGETCMIKSVTYGAEDPTTHRKAANISTQAVYRGAWSNMKVSASSQNPT